jgi:DNA polymerase III delta subunit
MNVILLHGDDTTKSYARLTKFIDTAKKRSWEVITDEFPNTPSLFGTDRLIIYRNYKLLTKQDIKNFNKFDDTLVVYHDGLLPQTFIKQMPAEFKLEKFELPKILFTFLESFYPGNSTRALQLLHELTKTTAIELVMFMLARHIRDLYWVSLDPNSAQFPSWRAGKLKAQAAKFGIHNLEFIINNLSDIDIKVKSSKADLLTELDLLIVKELE